jgi:hypothetical protein
MKFTPHALTGLLRAALALLVSATCARSAVTFADITLWAGAAPGPGINQAALIIDFRDGSPGLAWGYRWPAAESRTGQEMLAAIIGADPALSADSIFFPNTLTYGARTRSFSDNGTPADFTDDRYWGYWVNNEVYYHPTDFLLNSHIVPPATEVVPLGSPYGPGHWVESSTGAAGRPLVDGSWDGWVWGPYLTQPGNALPAIPEPSTAWLAAIAVALLGRRGRRPQACCGALAISLSAAAAGPFPGGPGAVDTDAIPAGSPLFKAWATDMSGFHAGPRQTGLNATPVSYGSAASVTGTPDAAGAAYPVTGSDPVPDTPVLSLGDGGSVTLTFAPPVADGEGADFAVFENGFFVTPGAVFAELAFVEVSSNGANFVRFPAVSATQTLTQAGNFSTLDPSNLHNLAGKHPAGYGTPFDLAGLADAPGLDVQRITHVRLVDVTGDVLQGRGSRDTAGNWINDPWPTNFQTGGFDLDAIGVIHQAGDGWEQWLAAPDDDPDGDGRTNLTEWAVGSAPDAPDDAPVLEVSAPDDGVALAYQHSGHAGLTLTPEQSPDGVNWSPLEAAQAAGPVRLTLARAPEGRAFYRLRILRTP